jgi:hypothetical protein
VLKEPGSPETGREADLRDRKRRVPQELHGPLDATANEISVRRLAERLLEAANEIGPRRMGLPSKQWNVERF